MEDVLARYQPGAAFDEMIDSTGEVRPSYSTVYETLRRATPDELRSIAESLASNYSQAGVTFDVGGVERPFPLDVVPRVIPADDWEIIDSGVAQRIRALEAFLADVYSDGKVITDGVIPRQLITSSSHYHRAVWGIQPPNGVRVHVGGIDLIRTPEGDVRVLEDNVRVPSGVSYVMTNRSSMVTAMPEAFGTQRIRPVAGYPQRLLAALRKAAPSGIDDPTVVVLTPGVYNSAYFEHTLLARTMGVELVEGRDLECRRGRVFMRTTAGLQRVDVIYRRIDDDFLDPVHFRQDSMLGVPGLVNAVRSGGVALANAIGNGVADDKLIYTYVPDLIRYFLREEPIIRNVDTWRLDEEAAREEVMDRLHELVVKPVDGSGGKGIVIGPAATADELNALRQRVLHDPRGWIAQPLVQLSTVPTLIGSGLEPRHVDLRPFAVNSGDDIWVLPGGLTRVALPKGELVVNSSQGGGSKDTWVLSQPLRLHAPDASDDEDIEDLDDLDDDSDDETEVDTTPTTAPPPSPPPPATPPGASPTATPKAAAAAAARTVVPMTIGGALGTVGNRPETLKQQIEQQQQLGTPHHAGGRGC
ncbi:MAG TPA: circularly permuted type 2 ATP-grasp protein [Microlunatus sp.]|nr:circularly permuted type 2 ATP-grasp protein [Microlunatus sp.]